VHHRNRVIFDGPWDPRPATHIGYRVKSKFDRLTKWPDHIKALDPRYRTSALIVSLSVYVVANREGFFRGS
jgi:hypothetical protein